MASPSIRDYKAQLNGGLLHANRYDVIIKGMPETVKFFVINAQMPAFNAAQVSAYYQSRQLKMAGTLRWQPLNLTMYANLSADNKMQSYIDFMTWYNTQQGIISNIGTNNPNDYWREVRIILLGNDGSTEMGEWVIQDALVTEMGPVEISYESEDLMKFNIVLEFSEADFNALGNSIF